MIKKIDINADVGEGVGNEIQLMPLLSSCNIACGGHAGDATSVRQVLRLAKKYNVKVGAHPSFPDKDGFGRRIIPLSRKQLKASLISQINLVQTLVTTVGGALHHVKPHGALYNLAAVDAEIADLIIETIREVDKDLILYAPYKSVVAQLAKGKINLMIEGFADRAYDENYQLVSRQERGAVLHDFTAVQKHIMSLFCKKLITINKVQLPFDMDTLCVHGDTIGAIDILKKIRALALKNQIMIL